MPSAYVLQVRLDLGLLLLCHISWFVANYDFLLRAYGSGKEDSPMCDVPGFENCRMNLLRLYLLLIVR